VNVGTSLSQRPWPAKHWRIVSFGASKARPVVEAVRLLDRVLKSAVAAIPRMVSGALGDTRSQVPAEVCARHGHWPTFAIATLRR